MSLNMDFDMDMDMGEIIPAGTAPPDLIRNLMIEYLDTNPIRVQELDSEPTPLEFMRDFVAPNTPLVIRGGAKHWEAVQKWDAAHLADALRGQKVNVAVTPSGRADAPALFHGDGTDGNATRLVRAKPLVEEQEFVEFLDYVVRQEKEGVPNGGEVRYGQTQDDNLRNEYASIFSQVAPDIPFARVALNRNPIAINMWIGNSMSVSHMHQDPYENIFVQVTGRKHFVLFPGCFLPGVNEQWLEEATYVRKGAAGDASGNAAATGADAAGRGVDGDNRGTDLVLRLDENTAKVPVAIWDPDNNTENRTAYSQILGFEQGEVEVTLEPGDMLYIPALWYHKVSQTTSEDGICVAVNYWYDMDYSGPLRPLHTLLRDLNLATRPAEGH